MQRLLAASILCAFASQARCENAVSNPLGKVIQLMDSLTAKVKADGDAEANAYHEYFEWCDETAANTANEITSGKSAKAKLEATIGELSARIETAKSEIEELGAALAQADSELEDATKMRRKEAADFIAGEKELVDTVDTLDRAIAILQREMSKNPAALVQLDTSSMPNLLKSLSAVVDAAGFASSDQKKLSALVQSQAAEVDSDDDAGAPAAAVYASKSGGIFDMLEDLKEKAEAELADLRKAESISKHNYEMLKQSLDDKSFADKKGMADEKGNKAAAEEGKAAAEGELEVTTKDLKAAEEKLAVTRSTCITVAADHEKSLHSRAEELKVIAEAKKILVETSGGAVEQAYSFVQASAATKGPGAVASIVKKLARKQRSAALAQLASRIQAVVRYGGASQDDVFAKVKGLITDMIGKLEKEAEESATEKKFCDEEMGKTEAKKADLDGDIAKLNTKVDQAAAKSTNLQADVKELQKEVGDTAKEQAEMDQIRDEEHQDYVKAKTDLELGLGGVRKALEVLRDYYAKDDGEDAFMQQPAKPINHGKADGAAGSIIGILEVCESDFAKNLAEVETAEADEAAAYDKNTQENKLSTAEKTKDVEYKTQMFNALDKTISDLQGDLDTLNSEHAAVMEYYGKLKERCVAKPESYEERKARREAELAGLKEALTVLEGETALVQRKHRHIRGVLNA